jgi:CHASE3 domain sensor protein
MKLRTQLLAGSAVVLLLMILIAAISYQNGRTMLASQDWIRHRQDLVAVGYDVQSNVVGMQSAERGYLLSGDEQQLQRFDGRRRAYATAIAGLKASLGDDPAQAGRVIEIASLVEDWLRTAGVEIAARRQVARGQADMGAVVRQFRPPGTGRKPTGFLDTYCWTAAIAR